MKQGQVTGVLGFSAVYFIKREREIFFFLVFRIPDKKRSISNYGVRLISKVQPISL
jgi:hypothetical protein